ncbi:MAG: hypothetical protein IPP49_18635 [Saprospiraceae bacterium]|nr:hypothetical protein [Saprospiraceae bacterium]
MTKEGLVKAKMELGASDAHITSNQMISKVRIILNKSYRNLSFVENW